MPNWLENYTEGWPHAIGAILLIVILAMVARWVLHRAIDRIVRKAEVGLLPERIQWLGSDTMAQRRVQRARTMGTVLKSIATIIVEVVAVLMVLSRLGIDIAPLIASAGIVGVALGFGAQNIVKDFLAGLFIIFEDQYGVGDLVDVGPASGTVEAVSLRVTRLRNGDGTVWYVRNGEILRVGNKSHNWAATSFDVDVARAEDLAKVRRVLTEVSHDLWEDEDYQGQLVEQPEVWGAEGLTPGAVTMRVNLKTVPLAGADVSRELRERVKARFEHEGIQNPPVG
ncbi:putative small-conductance mechanosensitive channel MscS [metagenome]|uniref:Putative small-conductance mechanosensitive channel MscS n=1 Tax=metagenome TaxID=256318 RepID=A0A2P2C8A6_9ZZZZ